MDTDASNSNTTINTLCLGMDESLCEKVLPRALTAVQALGIERSFHTIEICGDYLPGYEEAWFRIVSSPTPAENRHRLVLFCPDGVFVKRMPVNSFDVIEAQIWDQSEVPEQENIFLEENYSASRTDQFLNHNLLLARDVVRKDLKPEAVPAGLAEAFQAAWAVTVDGRLSQLGLPGYTVSTRRGIFSRLFSAAGVLLPDHWQVFQALWDGALRTNKDVLAVVRLLPRL